MNTHTVLGGGQGTLLYLGAQQLDVPHTLTEPENVLAGRDWKDDGERGGAGFHVR